MLKKVLSTLVFFIVFSAYLRAEEIQTKVVHESSNVAYLDAVMYGDELYFVSYNSSDRTLKVWSETHPETVIAKGEQGDLSHPSMAVIDNKIAVAYYDSGTSSYKLWVDDPGNLEPNDDEFITIKNFNGTDFYGWPSIKLVSYKDKALLVYPNIDNKSLEFWYGGVSKSITSKGGEHPDIVIYNDNITVSYYSNVLEGFKSVLSINVWCDENGNLENDEGEITVIEEVNNTGIVGPNSMTVYDDHLAVTYSVKVQGKLKLWNDADGDLIAAGDEVILLDYLQHSYFPSLFVYKDNLALACRKNTWPSSHVNLWLDDGDVRLQRDEVTELKPETESTYGTLLKAISHKGDFKLAYLKNDIKVEQNDFLVSTNAASIASASGTASAKRSSGKSCIVTRGSFHCYIVVVALLLIVGIPWKLSKG